MNATEAFRRCCDYCGLPIRGTATGPDSPAYCCLGCRIAQQVTQRGETPGMSSKLALRLGMAVFFTMNVMVFTLVLWSWDTYSIARASNAATFKELMRIACWFFATPVVIILLPPLAESAVSQILRRVMTADVLLVAGVLASYLYSVASILTGGPHIYFEVTSMILVAVTLGRWLEAEGRQRATKSLQSLQRLLPDSAAVWENGCWVNTPLDQVHRHQTIQVLPGERIPLDGQIVTGASSVDEQLVTGETEPRQVEVHDQVFGGAGNLDGTLEIEVTAGADEGVVQRLISAVRAATRMTSAPERLADKLATILATVTIVVATSVFALHMASAGMHEAMMSSMAVVLIACPCALAVATPLAVWSALSRAAADGVVFQSSDSLLQLARITHVCLDKTGTLTKGVPRVASAVFDDDAEVTLDTTQFGTEPGGASNKISSAAAHRDATSMATISGSAQFPIQLLVTMAHHSRHPLALAARDHWKDSSQADRMLAVKNVQATAGMGVSATWNDCTVMMGSERFCRNQMCHVSDLMAESLRLADRDGRSVLCLSWNQAMVAVVAFEESVREASAGAIKQLGQLGVACSVLTGDRRERAETLGESLGVPVESALLPDDKYLAIQRLQREGHRVAMVGDGLNDAPSMLHADVGIAMGCGVEITREHADVCLLTSNLENLPKLIHLGRSTRKTILRNLVWAASYNSVGIALAACGRLNPIFAAVAMVASSLFVISDSLRLRASTNSGELAHG